MLQEVHTYLLCTSRVASKEQQVGESMAANTAIASLVDEGAVNGTSENPASSLGCCLALEPAVEAKSTPPRHPTTPPSPAAAMVTSTTLPASKAAVDGMGGGGKGVKKCGESNGKEGGKLYSTVDAEKWDQELKWNWIADRLARNSLPQVLRSDSRSSSWETKVQAAYTSDPTTTRPRFQGVDDEVKRWDYFGGTVPLSNISWMEGVSEEDILQTVELKFPTVVHFISPN